jgi:hypothetical protein
MEQTHLAADRSKPLIATLAISMPAQSYFNELRRQHFPANRNYLDAHLTLFHALPDQPLIRDDLEELVKNQQSFDVIAQSIVSIGNGTAIKIISPELPLLYQKLQNNWFDILTNQDRQKRNFHITIQNKVEPQAAKKLQTDLMQDFEPFPFTIHGIQLWRYLGGPWEYLTKFDFEDISNSDNA